MEPLEVRVTLKTDDEVLELRKRVKELEGALEAQKAAYNRVEYMYRCESIVNQELVDLCRATGVKIRAGLGRRPW